MKEPFCGWQYFMEHGCVKCKIGGKCHFYEEMNNDKIHNTNSTNNKEEQPANNLSKRKTANNTKH
jgi:hypothetical protein